ncbi:universal stress protein [Legionella parisiensis]|uniref:Universal stress protein E n=1 Tax=Legionella parisiensis TaxID=45071 RepID=A0A1E5JPZ9_9GAMM|nr:universal stress protein [Legionella parisiensis]KTD44415.1 universal stress family protein [Legionella parisiensis]OEH46530.1 Universal stress protein E [Legionella parisiensis]STX72043.1 universal stress family protein [Legionella parisiensis]
MKQFHNILFVSNGIDDEIDALQHAIRLAVDNKANLDIVIVLPPFPHSLDEYKSSYEMFLIEKMNQTLKSAITPLSLHKKESSIKIEIECGNAPDIRIIQRVLRHPYDLVVKAAEQINSNNKGFRALDMALLRQCPCTLFLHRPINPDETIHIAVAIDPRDEEISGHDLAINLLKLSYSLSIHYESKLSVITCWEFVLEDYLRRSVLINAPSSEVDEMVMKESRLHYSALSALIQESGIKEQPNIYHLKGRPAELIPLCIKENKIDILVMGTVARTGISGFFIGNTAENILQKINCSLWALKPQGFVSPVRAY